MRFHDWIWLVPNSAGTSKYRRLAPNFEGIIWSMWFSPCTCSPEISGRKMTKPHNRLSCEIICHFLQTTAYFRICWCDKYEKIFNKTWKRRIKFAMTFSPMHFEQKWILLMCDKWLLSSLNVILANLDLNEIELHTFEEKKMCYALSFFFREKMSIPYFANR